MSTVSGLPLTEYTGTCLHVSSDSSKWSSVLAAAGAGTGGASQLVNAKTSTHTRRLTLGIDGVSLKSTLQKIAKEKGPKVCSDRCSGQQTYADFSIQIGTVTATCPSGHQTTYVPAPMTVDGNSRLQDSLDSFLRLPQTTWHPCDTCRERPQSVALTGGRKAAYTWSRSAEPTITYAAL